MTGDLDLSPPRVSGLCAETLRAFVPPETGGWAGQDRGFGLGALPGQRVALPVGRGRGEVPPPPGVAGGAWALETPSFPEGAEFVPGTPPPRPGPPPPRSPFEGLVPGQAVPIRPPATRHGLPGLTGRAACVGPTFEPPPFENVATYTQLCFRLGLGVEDWPETTCPAPCIAERPCALPDDDRIDDALEIFVPIVLTTATTGIPSGWTLLAACADLADDGPCADERRFVGAATALLLDNLDLVEWAVCRALSWSPLVDDDLVQPILDCILGGLQGGANLYLVDTFPANGVGGAIPTGGATDLITDVGEGTLEAGAGGPVIPIHHPYWRDSQDWFEAGGPPGLCATAHLASVILHELVHFCAVEDRTPGAPPAGSSGLAEDAYNCWAVQNMAAMMFLWAMGQRHPCIHADLLPCCVKTTDTYFASSEPDFANEGMPFAPWGQPCS